MREAAAAQQEYLNSMDIQLFVQANEIKLTPECKVDRCVDGRYEGLEDFPGIAKPGASAGDVMVAFGALNNLELSLPNQQVLQAVIDTIGGADKFRFHTDDHAEHDQLSEGMGCGHLKHAKNDPAAYGLQPDQINFIFEQLPTLVTQGAKQEVLHGDHAEQAVLVVESDHYSVKPMVQAESGVEEAFVYQKTMHEQQLHKLAELLTEQLHGTGNPIEPYQVEKAVEDAFGKQLNQTLRRLAPDKPVHVVKIAEDGSVSMD